MFSSRQYLFAGIIGGLSGIIFFAMQTFVSLTHFIILCGLWILLVSVAHALLRYVTARDWSVYLLAVSTVAAFVGLMLFVELRAMPSLEWFLVVSVILAMMMVHIPITHDIPLPTQKAVRRMRMMLWVFDGYASLICLYGIHQLFPNVSLWILTTLMSLILGGISVMIWRMYVRIPSAIAGLWGTVVAFMMVEFIWVMHLLPFGYLASGLLTAWMWYVLQLLIRFHLGTQDIVWRRQRLFLIGNAILYALTLGLFVRWV